MAIRPVVLVYQDLASPTVTPTTPDLNCLVVGPAYHIQDYFQPGTTDYADKDDIELSAPYGVLEGNPVTATPVGPAYITVAEPPNNEVGALLDGDSVVIYFDEARVRMAPLAADGVTSTGLTANVITSASALWNTGDTKLAPGDRITIKDAGVNVITLTVASIVSDTSLTTTADVALPFVAGAAQSYVVERQLNDQPIDSSFVTTTNNVTEIAGGVTLTVPGQGIKVVSYARVFEQYRSLRQDLIEVDTVESLAEIESKIGRLDSRNPLASGVFVALQNTTSRVQFVGTLSNDVPGHLRVRDMISSRPDIYAIVPMTTDVSVLAMWKSDVEGLALPDEVQGRPQRFRVVIGSGTLPITKTIIEPSAVGISEQVAATAPTEIVRIELTGIANLVTGGVIPSDIVRVTATTIAGIVALGDYPVASVRTLNQIEVDTVTPFASAGVVDITVAIFEADGVTVRIASAALVGVITSVGDDLFLFLRDPSGTFVASGVAAGDLIKIPVDPNATITETTVFTTVVVEAVLSDQRLRIVNNGQDGSATVNELPHGVKRIGGALVTLTAINYTIERTLNKSQQVTDLIGLAQSFDSKRVVLVWPDECNVAGVTGGSGQPGYYLSCAVGGMTAGLPSQQGFTNLGIAGISQIFNANTYFTDLQITDLSNGGWYVFSQQTPQSLPFTIHQLTTDPSTLESGEFSIVKNFDFVALFFVDILEDFLGQYNVTLETLILLQGALNTGGELLKLRTQAKIGAPLTSFAITNLGVSAVSGDRVVAYVAIGLPKPLNVIELHLVA
jgi:hypothetical protein